MQVMCHVSKRVDKEALIVYRVYMVGTVCYIDLLGFSYLTANPEIKKRQGIASRYVKNLHKYIKQSTENTNIKYCILSDSVFLFVENELDIMLFALTRIFRNCICAGVLLRAGIAFGEYNFIKTDIETKNIFGAAVTKAVSMEKLGKGCRIFVHDELPNKSTLLSFNPNIFVPYKNYYDYSELDVFEWPFFYQDFYINIKDNNDKEKIGLRSLLFNNCKILAYLKHSPLFNWNIMTDEGKIHIKSTIEYITNITNNIICKKNVFNPVPVNYSLDISIRKEVAVNNLIEFYKKEFNVQ